MTMPNFGIVGKDYGSAYVPNMTHHHHIGIDNETTVLLENTPVDGAELLASTALGAAATLDDLAIVITSPFGRTLSLTSADADGVLTVYGRDYLGQQMTQQVTMVTSAGATTKAFKYVDKVISSTNDGAITITCGSGHGLPFCAQEIVRETVDGVAATEGTITAAVSTTPSATTGDVRGTFNPNTATDSAKDIEVTYVTTNRLTGGLYGQPQA